MELGLEANVSARHISFIESGRAKPSREMIFNLAQTLQMSKSHTNMGFLAAGFAPRFKSHENDSEDMVQISHAIEIMLKNHMPYPALLMDNHWNILNANPAAVHLLNRSGFSKHKNLVEALMIDAPESSAIENWHEVMALIIQRLKVELFQQGEDDYLSTLVDRLSAHFDAHTDRLHTIDYSQAVIPTRLNLEGKIISVFSTLAQFGSVLDVTMCDMKIEMMFPADSISRTYFEKLS